MSLFTFKEIWTVDGSEELGEVCFKAVTVANIDNSANGSIKFAVGSLTGILRIIGHKSVDREEISSTVSVLAELDLGFPILEIESGIFIGGSKDENLAILHPFKLAVYSVSKLPGEVEHGAQYKVTLLYEHLLKRHAFNMCCGPFGHGHTEKKKGRSGSQGRSFICVQSLDGTLSFFEQELFTFCRYLPGFLLPGQLAYVPPWDGFLTLTSWNLVCFKYTSLAMSKDDPFQQQLQDTSIGKRLTPDWSFSIGEECIGDIQVLSTDDPATTCVVVCTFRSIMCFGDGGILVWAKRLDHHISAFHSFLVPLTSNPNEHECITVACSSEEPYICYVYGGTTLRWAAKLPFSPICIYRLQHSSKKLNGSLFIMDGRGTMVVGCLGTVPSIFVAPPVTARDLDYESAEKELSDLRKAIASAGDPDVKPTKDNSVELKLEFEGQKTKWIESNGLEVMSLIGTIKILCHLKVNDVRVTVSTPKPVICNPESVLIGDMIGRHSFPLEFYMTEDAIPSDLQFDVFLFYVDDNGSPHFVQKCGIKIPLFVVAKPHHRIQKDGDAKLTFSVNRPVIDLLSLYNDFQWNIEQGAPGLSFKFYNGETASLLSSTKNASNESSKYRIQSDSLVGIYIIFRDFLDRLQRRLGRDKNELVVEPVGLDDEITLLNDYFKDIDLHAVQRQRDSQIKEELSDRAAQLRAVQRRLLIRFRDKNPTPMTQLETLLEGSLEQLGDCLSFIDGNHQEMEKTEIRLSGGTKLLLELVKLKRKDSEDVLLLFNALSPDVWNFSEDCGWEECAYTALTFLKGGMVVNLSLANLDLSKLKKVIKSVIEKVWKDASLKKSISAEPNGQKATTSQSEPADRLIGNEIQERMTSARGRASRKMSTATTLASIPEPYELDAADAIPDGDDAPQLDQIKEMAEVYENNNVGSEEEDNLPSKLSKPKLKAMNDSFDEKGKESNGVSKITEDSSDDNFW